MPSTDQTRTVRVASIPQGGIWAVLAKDAGTGLVLSARRGGVYAVKVAGVVREYETLGEAAWAYACKLQELGATSRVAHVYRAAFVAAREKYEGIFG